ncbi:MAG: NAD-dependent epimerase/dehydratase family protein [Clostridia bacterium]|nr:NAD-dependent epimerase/dehydratase family protein [Clostridia bacterium]
MSKKILVPGGTGAMGVYLIPELLKMGYQVDVIALDVGEIQSDALRYIQADAKNYDFIAEQLKNGYDAVVDFMVYPKREEYERFLPLYLNNTQHYIYLSSYRVYANEEQPVKETSPRLLDVSTDSVLLSSGDYCIYKAQGEDFLRNSKFDHFTIIRPAITYSKRRFQLITMEYPLVVRRMLEGKTLVLPEAAMNVQATMSWAGDVAKMIARLLLNPKAYRETYSVCTAEHHTWGEIAEMYARIGGLNYCTTDTDTFLQIISPNNIYARQQLVYDRYFERIMDNSKILEITGMKQSELMPLEQGLAMELAGFSKDTVWAPDDACERMDRFLSQK